MKKIQIILKPNVPTLTEQINEQMDGCMGKVYD